MDRLFVVQEAYANALSDHSAQSYMVALRMFCPRYMDKFSICRGDGDFLPPDEQTSVIPVGTIDYVRQCLRTQQKAGIHGTTDCVDTDMRPLEVPDALLPYVGREYRRMMGREIPDCMLDGSKWFLKDASHLKRWNSSLHDFGTLGHLVDPDTEYVVSERVSFVSEWRVFVHEDEIIACQNYLGDVLRFPDGKAVSEMVSQYAKTRHPHAYTFDIGVMQGDTGLKTVPIEVHPFVSCGLYGMFDMLIPNMLEAGYRWYLGEGK